MQLFVIEAVETADVADTGAEGSSRPTVVLRVAGELDASRGSDLKTVIQDHARGAACEVVLDLWEVGFIDTAGLRALLESGERLTSDGGRLLLRRPAKAVRRMLARTGTEERFIIHEA